MEKIDSNRLFAILGDKSRMYQIIKDMTDLSVPYIFVKLNKVVMETDWEAIQNMSAEDRTVAAVSFEKKAVLCMAGEVHSGAVKKLFVDRLTDLCMEKFGIAREYSAEWLNRNIEALNAEARQIEREEKIAKLSRDLSLAKDDSARMEILTQLNAALSNASFHDSVSETVNRERNFFEELCSGYDTDNGFFTGYEFRQGLEQNEPPFQLNLDNGRIYLVAAMTGHGKTRMLENLALREVCMNHERGKVVYISLEESKFQTQRQFAKLFLAYKCARVSYNGMEIDNLIENAVKPLQQMNFGNPDDYIRFLCSARGRVAQSRTEYFASQCMWELKDLFDNRLMLDTNLVDGRSFTLETMVEYVKEVRNQYGIKALFIDYVQLLKPTESRDNLMDLKKTMQVLKELKNDLNIPVVIASQLSRNCDCGVPSLNNSAVAEAHDIIDGADMCLMLYNLRHVPQKRLGPEKDRYANDYGVRDGIVCRITKSRVSRVGLTQEFLFFGQYGAIFQPVEQQLQQTSDASDIFA